MHGILCRHTIGNVTTRVEENIQSVVENQPVMFPQESAPPSDACLYLYSVTYLSVDLSPCLSLFVPRDVFVAPSSGRRRELSSSVPADLHRCSLLIG